jgi:hypothetical protein
MAAKEIEDDTAEICKVGHVYIKANEFEKLVAWIGGERLERREAGTGESGWQEAARSVMGERRHYKSEGGPETKRTRGVGAGRAANL